MASFFTYRKDLYRLCLLIVEIVTCVSRILHNIKPIATKLVGLYSTLEFRIISVT